MVLYLLLLGVVARFDFSWHDPEYHQETLENLKVAIKTTKKLCAVSFLPSLFFLVVAFVTLVLQSGGICLFHGKNVAERWLCQQFGFSIFFPFRELVALDKRIETEIYFLLYVYCLICLGAVELFRGCFRNLWFLCSCIFFFFPFLLELCL